MEKFLSLLNNLQTCYSKYKPEDFDGKTPLENQSVCIDESLEFSRYIFSNDFNVKNLNLERIRILEEVKKEKAGPRRKFLMN